MSEKRDGRPDDELAEDERPSGGGGRDTKFGEVRERVDEVEGD